MVTLPNDPALRNGAVSIPVIFSSFDGKARVRYPGRGGSRPATRAELALALSAGVSPIAVTCYRDMED